MGFDLSYRLFGCVAVAFFLAKDKSHLLLPNTHKYSITTFSNMSQRKNKDIYIYFFILCICWLWSKKIATIFSAHGEFCSFVMWLECSWDEGSKDASCPFWMPRRAQAPIERVTIGAIFPSNHRLFERVLGAAKFTATADLSPPKKSYLTFNRNSCKSDGLFSAKCLRCNSFVNLKRTDKKWTRAVKWWRQL